MLGINFINGGRKPHTGSDKGNKSYKMQPSCSLKPFSSLGWDDYKGNKVNQEAKNSDLK